MNTATDIMVSRRVSDAVEKVQKLANTMDEMFSEAAGRRVLTCELLAAIAVSRFSQLSEESKGAYEGLLADMSSEAHLRLANELENSLRKPKKGGIK